MRGSETRIGFGDLYGTTAEVEPEEHEIRMRVAIGQCGGTGYLTPAAARQLASTLLDAADTVEEAGEDS